VDDKDIITSSKVEGLLPEKIDSNGQIKLPRALDIQRSARGSNSDELGSGMLSSVPRDWNWSTF
jgi:hypothetical protein